MKLGEILDLIPDYQEFVVEEYIDRDMTYAWWIRPFNTKDRDELNLLRNNEVSCIETSTINSYENEDRGVLAISILYKPGDGER